MTLLRSWRSYGGLALRSLGVGGQAQLATALLLACLVRDTPAKVEGWLARQGLAPAATAHSRRFQRQATLWRGGPSAEASAKAGDRWAIVLPDGAKACVIDMGRGWRRLGGGPSPDPSAEGSGPQAEGSGPRGEPARLRQPVARSLGDGGGFGGQAY